MTVALPINLSEIDTAPEAIERDALYGAQVAKVFGDWVSNTSAQILGARVLELGPGTSFCGAIGLVGHGASRPAFVADRWVAPWRENYHPKLYSRVAELLRDEGRAQLAAAFESAARDGHEDLVRSIEAGAERIPLPDVSIDMVFSNAVLEHLADQEASVRELFRISSPGAWHFHQIDYRDHRDFSRSLEHLLVSADHWREHSEGLSEPWSHGTQLRLHDHIAMFESAGFEVVAQFPEIFPDLTYAREIAAKLGCAPETLHVFGALVILRRH